MAEPLPSQRGLFGLPRHIAYLNCAYFSPKPLPVREAGLRAVERQPLPWEVSAADFFEPGERLRESFAELIGGDADGVAFVPSASYGVGVAARILEVGPGRTAVLIEDQFPSDVYPWRAAVAEGGGILVTAPHPRSGDWTESILSRIDHRTAVVVAPQGHWTDGRRVDLVRVGQAARSVGAALVVDASQSLGAVPFDLGEIRPDFLVAVGYKWLLGPYSFGYLWVGDRHRRGLPLEATWTGRKGSEDFARLVDYTDEYRSGARRFDVGEWSNFVLLPMAAAAIDLLLEWRPERVAAGIAPLTALIEQGTRELGLDPLAASDRLPNMIGVRFPGGIPGGLSERLAAHHIYVSVRGNAVRVSPHLYNDEEDVARLLGALGSATS